MPARFSVAGMERVMSVEYNLWNCALYEERPAVQKNLMPRRHDPFWRGA